MDYNNDNLPTDKPNPMKKTDWVLLTIVILLLLLSFPILWRLYRFLIPLVVIGFIVYVIFRFIKTKENASVISQGVLQNFTSVWIEIKTLVRTFFRRIVLTSSVVIVLAVLVLLSYGHYSKSSVTEKEMALMTQSLAKYKSHFGYYPAGLAELIGNDPLKKEWLQDSWGNQMAYKVSKDGLGYKLSSPGVDGKIGNGDDLILEK